MSGTIVNAKNPSNIYQPLNVDASGRLECSVNEIEITAGDISVAVDGLEGLQQTTIDKIILPTALTGSGNLKVSIQELGNEGSERLNVDVGDDITQLPSSLTGAGNLKVSLEAMNGSGTGISTSAKQDTTNLKLDHLSDNLDTINSSVGDLATESTLNIIAEEFTKCDTDNITITGGLTGSGNLKVCIQELGNEGSERLNVDIGNAVAQLPTALSGSGRLKIENDISGFSTASLQGAGLPSALSGDNLKVSLKETISVPVTHTTLTNLDNAINSDKVDVNISSGNITGFSTSANQSTANGHLLALANIVNPAIATATATTIPNKLDTIETSANGIETKITLATSAEVKELLSGVTINFGAQSSEFDTENYERVRFFGESTTSVGTDIVLMGSNASGGTFYILGENLRSETIGSTHYVYGAGTENLPRYIKILNKSGSSNYVFTKLYLQGSGGRLLV